MNYLECRVRTMGKYLENNQNKQEEWSHVKISENIGVVEM